MTRDALALARQVVGDSEDRPEIVGRVVPQGLVASCVKAGTTKNAAALFCNTTEGEPQVQHTRTWEEARGVVHIRDVFP